MSPRTPSSGADTGRGGLTTGGLARRVPGANLPPAGPFTIKRGRSDAPATPAGPPPADAPQVPAAVRRDEKHPQAENVYTLLTSFTLGVQRGLDETAATPPPAPPGDEEHGRS